MVGSVEEVVEGAGAVVKVEGEEGLVAGEVEDQAEAAVAAMGAVVGMALQVITAHDNQSVEFFFCQIDSSIDEEGSDDCLCPY